MEFNDGSTMQSVFESGGYNDEVFRNRQMRFLNTVKRAAELEQSQASKLDAVRFEIAVCLYNIHKDKLYLESKYKNVSDLASDVLHFNKVTTNNYIRVARNFLDKNRPVSVFARNGQDFGMSQLIELVQLSEDEVVSLMEAGKISFESPVASIRAAVKDFKEQRAKDKEEANKAAMKPYETAHEAFHKAYNNLKAHLEELGDDEGADVLLPEIMGAVVDLYQEGLKGLTAK